MGSVKMNTHDIYNPFCPLNCILWSGIIPKQCKCEITDIIINKSTRKPYKCPVCEGYTVISDRNPEIEGYVPCHSCDKGVVWG